MNTERAILLTLGVSTHTAILALILGSAFLRPDVPLDWQSLIALIALEAGLLKIDIENPLASSGSSGSSGNDGGSRRGR